METLTLEKLKKMEPGIFAEGVGLIVHPWFNNATLKSEGGVLEDDHKHTLVKWVAVRGGIEDWAIYHSMDANITEADYFNSPEHLLAPAQVIANYGAKVHDREIIKNFVPCDDEALGMYRD